jgi:MerR family transcriptional regulator, light-induced transcriptional regulator
MQLSEAAAALGVHYQTAYAWVRQGTLPALKASRGYEVSEADVAALAGRRATGVPPRREAQVRDWDRQAGRLLNALVTGDESQAQAGFTRLSAGTSLTELCDRVVAPALRQVGALWALGELSIATEHRAAAICERLITARTATPAGRPRGVAVTATPPDERHALPTLMAAACLREDHWQVHHLSADLPPAEIITLAGDTGARLVVLSAATAGSAEQAARDARHISDRLPQVRVLAGRPGATLAQLRDQARPRPAPLT